MTVPRVALIHYWLVGLRGGERVLQSLARMFPQADIITHVFDPRSMGEAFAGHRVTETWIGRLPGATRFYQAYLPFMPNALEEVDLSGYDLVISSEAGPAKGVIAPPGAVHLCYCHSPMRYIWDQYHVYRARANPLRKAMMPFLSPRLRIWDVTSAARVDRFAANSRHVAARIAKYWRREADVVHPPVAVQEFQPAAEDERGDFYLWAGELAPYKRPDLAIEAFNRLGLPLVMIGGPDKAVRNLKKLAKGNIKLLGKTDFATLRYHLARCKALVFPGEEDFGIVPVEAMASGRPVIAYGRGGVLDTIVDGETGLLFEEQSVEGLIEGVVRFEALGLDRLDPHDLIAHAARFGESQFQRGIASSLSNAGVPGAWLPALA